MTTERLSTDNCQEKKLFSRIKPFILVINQLDAQNFVLQ